jgi:anti-sigma regulatory factor (Ser/Thr protein kinase)
LTEIADGEVVIDLPDGLDAPRIARAFLAEHALELDDSVRQDAQLLVSEIVTNAVRHGRPNITLRLTLHPPGIGVAVHDFGPGIPTAPTGEPDLTSEGGRGLFIVAALASEWGIEPAISGTGKTVWFRLQLPAADRDPV